MFTVYTSPLCPDCRECKANFEAHGLAFKAIDITGSMPALKEFLRLRDSLPVFEACREKGQVGIPAILREDGSVTLDWEGVLNELRLPVVYRENGPACGLDGRGC